MRKSVGALAALCVSSVLSACGGGGAPDPMPETKPVGIIEAQALAGPFADVAAFCAQLGQPACEGNDRILMLLSSHEAPLKTRAGQTVKLVTVASRDAKAQYGHLLLTINGKLWAMPPVLSYDPSGGRRVSAATMRFAQDEAEGAADDVINLMLSNSIEVQPGGETETEEFNVYCKVGPKPACFRAYTTLALMDSLDHLNPLKAASVLLIPTKKGAVLEVNNMGQIQMGDKFDPERNARLLPEGEHAIKYP